MAVLIHFMAELCSKTCGLGRKNLPNSETVNHPKNFNNPQSSQKRQSDDSELQIAKTKFKRVLPLSFSDSDSE